MRYLMLTKKENIKDEMKNNKNAKNNTSISSQGTHNSCCPPIKTENQSNQKTAYISQSTKQQPTNLYTDKQTRSKTCITVKYDVGYPNQLYIRGKGANLSWDKGQLLKNTKPDEWVWETDAPFTNCEFKVLINDHVYENGDNHHLNVGSNILYTPHFY